MKTRSSKLKLSAVKNSPFQFWFLRFSSRITSPFQRAFTHTPVLVWFRKAKQIFCGSIIFQKQNYTPEVKNGRNFVKPKQVWGFTLIELLVVISVIALLASVIMAGLSDARTKAENSGTVQQIDAYLKAAELYQVDNGHYPTPTGTVSGADYCLGDYAGTTCGFSFSPKSENSGLVSSFIDYIKGAPMVSGKAIILYPPSGVTWTGALYRCTDDQCGGIKINWWLSGQSQSCGFGATRNESGFELFFSGTECTITRTR